MGVQTVVAAILLLAVALYLVFHMRHRLRQRPIKSVAELETVVRGADKTFILFYAPL